MRPPPTVQSHANPERHRRWWETPWTALAVLGLATFLRAYGAHTWSLWQDEETSVYFSQNLHKSFPRSFPAFFVLLHSLYAVTGVSVLAGRLLAAGLGVGSIALLYGCLRRLVSPTVAVVGAFLLAVNFGHLFWSQSIRYYTLLLIFQTLSMYWFVHGFERDSWWELLLANLALLLGLHSHFSGALLMPVFVAHLGLAILRRESGGGYHWRGYLTFGGPFVLVAVYFAWMYSDFRAHMAHLITSTEVTSLTNLGMRIALYFGVPLLGLGAMAAWLGRTLVSTRLLHFWLFAGFLPLLELGVLAHFNLVITLWYQAFVAFVGLTALAGITVAACEQRGARRLAVFLVAASLLYSAPFLYGYYTSMYGDRPRWQEAAAYLRQAGPITVDAATNPPIFATVPGSLAFHLGVPPATTMGHPLVTDVPTSPPIPAPTIPQWHVVEAGTVKPAHQAWLARHCTLKAHFDAHTGPKDRTVRVYYCAPPP